MKDHKKLVLEFANSEGGVEVETVWVIARDDGYEIDNIPFYAKELACGDVVAATRDEDGRLRFSGLIKASGHSTIRVLVEQEEDVSPVREALKKMGCPSEVSDISRLVAVDVPPEVSYDSIRAFLDAGAHEGRFDFEEACLGFK